MSSVLAPGPAVPPSPADQGTPPGGVRRRLPRGTAYVVIGLVAVLSVLAYALLAARGQDFRGIADPQNAHPNGGRAVAQVLGERGVDVVVVRSQAELTGMANRIDGQTTVLVADTSQLTTSTARRLAEVSDEAAELVLLDAQRWLVEALDLPVRVVASSADSVTADCSTELADPDDTLTGLRHAYPVEPGVSAQDCFTDADGPHLVQLALPDRPETTLVGSVGFVVNDEVLTEENAALALRLLGSTDRLVWYVPDIADGVPTDEDDRETVVPAVVGPGVLVLVGAVVGLMLWRGRRLGRLVTEPLPVVVRAVETTESRGRLYRRAKDRNRALVVLQQAARTRLEAYLGLPPGGPASSIATAVAGVTGRRVEESLWLLRDARADDDEALVRIAGEVAQLERAVRDGSAGRTR